MTKGAWTALAGGVCVVALVAPTPVRAQTQGYRIAPGSLKSALDAWARRSGRQVIYKVDDIRQARSAGAAGDLSADAALSAVLAGSGFGTQGDGSGAVAIVAVRQSSSGEGEAGSTAADSEGADIVVTGSILRRSAKDVPPTLTRLSAEELTNRGLTTASAAIMSLPSNNAASVPNNFSGNGAFSIGGTAISMRGLTSARTLVLFDGLRSAYYPLADGGARNFVDLNTIPDAIIDHIDALQEGASSTYGADAIAGVVNVVVKKQIVGLHADLGTGISQRGDAAQKRASLSAGIGKLDTDGWNVYAVAEYQHDDTLLARDRGYPYNTSDLSKLCATSIVNGAQTCRSNNIVNGLQFNGAYTGIAATTAAVVQPYDAANRVAQGRYQLLSGCGSLTPITLTAAQAGTTGALQNCQQDLQNQYRQLQPEATRIGGTIRATANLSDRAQLYVMANFYQDRTFFGGLAGTIGGTTPPAASGVTYSTATLALPVYVCAGGVGCNATNGTLNPNNPFAAKGQVARILYRFADIPNSTDARARTYRVSTGLSGSFGDAWHYDLGASASLVETRLTYVGVPFVQHILDVVADGSYNFVDPSKNTQAVRDYVAPTNVSVSRSRLAQVQGNVGRTLFDLPGGQAQVAAGGALRYEAINAPSANPDATPVTERYFTINPFGAIGHRWVESGYFELAAPIFKQLQLDGAGRYDHYSSGEHNFSPKIGARFAPIAPIAFHATYSQGFRVAGFAEANAPPTTGYTPTTPPASFIAAHGNDAYAGSYSLGATKLGTVNLKPERSRTFTGGVSFQPVRNLTLTADYYDIVVKDVITSANFQSALTAYYAGQPIPAGFKVIADAPDPQYPNALPRAAFVQYGYVNANRLVTSGLDFGANLALPIAGPLKLASRANATYVIRYNQVNDDGTVQHYADTLGPYQISSASGTPRWRGVWSNTLDTGAASLTATANYTSGYGEMAEDNRGVAGNCLASVGTGTPAVYRDNATPVLCRTKSFFTIDLHGAVKVGGRFTLSADVTNLFDAGAPYDPATFGGYQYNFAWAASGIVGRYFKVGAKVDF